VGSILCAATQYFGDPIICDFGSANVDGGFAAQHCWIHGSNWIDPKYQEDFDCVVNHGETFKEEFFEKNPIQIWHSFMTQQP
jgi:hypothetical protein